MAVLLVSIAGLSIGLGLFFLFFSVLFGRGFATRAQGDTTVALPAAGIHHHQEIRRPSLPSEFHDVAHTGKDGARRGE